MASYYKRLKRDLSAAAAEGLLTPQQADALYENLYSKRLFASFKAVHWISIIAGIFIAGGFSMIIAHNWDKLGSMLKIAGFLAAYAAAAEAAIRGEDKPVIGIPAGVVWFCMPPIGIGLYAQIFNLSGDPIKPFAAWALISLPLAFLSRRGLAAALSATLLFGVIYFGAFTPDNIFSLTKWRFDAVFTPPPLAHWLSVAAMFGAVFWVYFARLKPGWRDRVAGGTLIWIFMALASPTFFQLHNPVFILLAAISLAVLWLGLGAEDETPARLPLLAWFAVVYCMTFFWHYKPSYAPHGADSPSGVVAAWLIFAAATVLTMFKPMKAAGSGKTAGAAAKTVLLVSMISAFLLFGATEAGAKAIAVIANGLMIISGLGLIISGSLESDEKRINIGIAVVFLIIITRFMDIFGTLLKTGMAFIVSGLVMGALAYFLNKTRTTLIEAARRRLEHE